MGKITFITGCAMSGKSRWAVSYFDCCDNVQYLCAHEKIDSRTMNRIIFNESSRSVFWDLRTDFKIEMPPADLNEYDNFIIDSVGKLVYDVLFDKFYELIGGENFDPQEKGEEVSRKIVDFVQDLKSSGGNIVVITNEAGFMPNVLNNDMWNYQQVLCTVNQRLAAAADEVYLSVSGIQFKIK